MTPTGPEVGAALREYFHVAPGAGEASATPTVADSPASPVSGDSQAEQRYQDEQDAAELAIYYERLAIWPGRCHICAAVLPVTPPEWGYPVVLACPCYRAGDVENFKSHSTLANPAQSKE